MGHFLYIADASAAKHITVPDFAFYPFFFAAEDSSPLFFCLFSLSSTHCTTLTKLHSVFGEPGYILKVAGSMGVKRLALLFCLNIFSSSFFALIKCKLGDMECLYKANEERDTLYQKNRRNFFYASVW